MKKIMTMTTTTLLLGLSLALSGCAATGMNGDMDNSMSTSTTEMKGPAMNNEGKTMNSPAGGQKMEKPKMESPAMQEAPAPMTDGGM